MTKPMQSSSSQNPRLQSSGFKSYLIEPKAPLIIRSGRPFDEISGTDPARFPPPSTIAGALRTAYARSNDLPLTRELARYAVAGPLPIMLDMLGQPAQILVPKPADAHYFVEDKEKQLIRAQPKPLNPGEGVDLPDGLSPVQLERTISGKPVLGPEWWSLNDLLRWRLASPVLSFSDIEKNAWMTLPDDIRTHVSINNKTLNAESGKLFQTAGLNMWQAPSEKDPLPQCAIALLACIDGDINSGLLNLGGERRLSAVRPYPNIWPHMPSDLAEGVLRAKGLSLTLLTPALYRDGWQPAWLKEGIPPGCNKLKLKLRAAAVNGWKPQSGWDLNANKSRATRKMAPAGSTYWFDVLEYHQPDIEKLWLQHISDDKQDRLDGFGLAVPFPYTPMSTSPDRSQ